MCIIVTHFQPYGLQRHKKYANWELYIRYKSEIIYKRNFLNAIFIIFYMAEHIRNTVQNEDGETFTHIETIAAPNTGTNQNPKLIGVHPTNVTKTDNSEDSMPYFGATCEVEGKNYEYRVQYVK